MSNAKRVNVPLNNPIEVDGLVVTELNLRPLKAKDLRRLETPHERKIAMMLELACFLSGQTEEVIDELEGEDVLRVLEVVGGFFAGSHLIGSE